VLEPAEETTMNAAVRTTPVEASINLLSRAQHGDTGALDILVERYTPRLRQWYSGRLPAGSRGMLDTYDLVQDAVMKAVTHLQSIEIRHTSSVRAYLCQVVSNRIIDLYRRAAVRPVAEELDERLVSPEPSPIEAAIGAEAHRAYEAALLRLKPSDRRAIILKIEHHRTDAEIAVAIDCPSAGAARVKVSRALGKLAKEMSRK
jgi:RNA polymerase sigma-70 factor (ECF subfamily)